jgi:sortase (surface protein transpeptidase)
VSETVGAAVSKNQIVMSSAAAPSRIAVGETSTDSVTIRGASAGWRGPVAASLHGPFRSIGAIRCDQEPAWQGSIRTTGPGTYTTPPVKLERPGWYVYRHVVPDDADHIGTSTPCTDPKERVKVEAVPRVTSLVSSDRVETGTDVFDHVQVEGLAGERATVQAALYGPFAARAAITCDGTPLWSGSLEATADGELQTDPVTLTVPGYYSYRETITASEFVRAAQTPCADVAETTLVPGRPAIRTRVSRQQARPGAAIRDAAVVTGLGKLSATVKVELFGPFATQGGMSCSGAPLWSATFTARGDGTYLTAPVTLDRAGYFTFRESIEENPEHGAVTTPCGETAETTVVRAVPRVTTLVSADVVRPGSTIYDRIRVQGLGRTAARIEAELFGPFATRSGLRCTGRPLWRGTVTASGDGEVRTRAAKVPRAGFYTYRERLVGSPLVTAVETECALVPETALGAPRITTGGRAAGPFARVSARADGPRPVRVQVPSLNIDAPVLSAAIDVQKGELAVSPNIHRTGWWRDGAVPGDRAGAVLIAGHVDSARAGPGAFFRLHDAKVGQQARVTTTAGRTFLYRIVSVRVYPKHALPTGIYSQRGSARLVLVTCGGPFDPAVGRYRDNIVVTAVPA